jgi:hypothetical protein
MSTLSGYLGDEMVVTASLGSNGHPGQPLILAELKQPGFLQSAQAAIAKMALGRERPEDSHRVMMPSSIGTIPQGQAVLLAQHCRTWRRLSPDAATLAQVAGTPSQFATTPFGSQIAAAYGSGVGLLFAADLQVSFRLAMARGPMCNTS